MNTISQLSFNPRVESREAESQEKLEIKAYFANERTFLSWMQLCTLLGGVALSLLNFGGIGSQVSAVVLTVITFCIIFYAFYLYRWRAGKIYRKEHGTFDEPNGPVVLAITLFITFLLNFVFTFIFDKS
ncbi:vacuolar transporter chaperone 1 [Basidiobolus meristosporus CBS 931.73]|uniref:Vacuolar transporter chaperone 1 n=1 Tax=Basidiobolus meristosporus CBS 931.73 TaxID=1314790 RepID=A0A1Y1YYS2_9FUNG|nr:vacuolar transporter chaperone 1 [Basidiobolus meristosporus CBS 931.73]|eukprot:ORY03172.1 vacuolar transporter chaperone 1 [Basidiobolus meristosporus CBS 931.73]